MPCAIGKSCCEGERAVLVELALDGHQQLVVSGNTLSRKLLIDRHSRSSIRSRRETEIPVPEDALRLPCEQ